MSAVTEQELREAWRAWFIETDAVVKTMGRRPSPETQERLLETAVDFSADPGDLVVVNRLLEVKLAEIKAELEQKLVSQERQIVGWATMWSDQANEAVAAGEYHEPPRLWGHQRNAQGMAWSTRRIIERIEGHMKVAREAGRASQ